MNASLVSGLSPVQMEMVLAHEIVHIQKWDLQVLWIQRITETLLFFCPAVILLGKEISRLREIRCDQVVARQYCPAEYAGTLVHCADLQREVFLQPIHVPFGLSAVAGAASFLGLRVRTLLAAPVAPANFRGKFRWPIAVGIGLISIASLLFFPIGEVSFQSLLTGQQQEMQVEVREIAKFDHPGWRWVFPSLKEVRETDFRFGGKPFALKSSIDRELAIEFPLDQKKCLFTEIQVGDSASKKIALMLRMKDGGVSGLYVDRDRDRRISENDECRRILVGKNGQQKKIGFFIRLDAVVGSENHLLKSERQLVAIPHQDGKSLQVHCLGFAEGKVKWKGREYKVRRYDRDGDFIATGSRDFFEVDLNHDGVFDWVNERFQLRRSVRLGRELASVFSDRMGMALELKPPGATGELKIVSSIWRDLSKRKGCKIECFEVKLENDQGMIVRTGNFDHSIKLPAGEYRVAEVSIQVRDEKKHLWAMDLVGSEWEDRWFDVTAQSTKTIEILDRLVLGIDSKKQSSETGQFAVSPSIKTRCGLVVTRFDREDGVQVSAFQGNPVLLKFYSSKVGSSSQIPAFDCGFM